MKVEYLLLMMILLLLKQKKMAINCDCAGEVLIVMLLSILTFLEVRQTGAWLEAGKPQSWMMVIFICIYVAANVQSKKKNISANVYISWNSASHLYIS